MSKSSSESGDRPRPRQGSSAAQAVFAKSLAVVVGVAVLAGFAWILLYRGAGNAPKVSPTATNQLAAPAATDAKPRPEHQKLLGQWLRPDGGYVLDLKNVDGAGKLEAAYYNPSPINVSRAYAWQDAGATKVFVELRGAGYPGSTYTLTYDPQRDVLHGVYFQAAMQQEYDVFFTRSKENQ